MRTSIFLVGIVLVILGPLVTLIALSSCFGTILSGHLLACVTDFALVVFGGVVFFVGMITTIVGAVVQDAPPPVPMPQPGPGVAPRPMEITCKKCGSVYTRDRFFCPSCGQRQ